MTEEEVRQDIKDLRDKIEGHADKIDRLGWEIEGLENHKNSVSTVIRGLLVFVGLEMLRRLLTLL